MLKDQASNSELEVMSLNRPSKRTVPATARLTELRSANARIILDDLSIFGNSRYDIWYENKQLATQVLGKERIAGLRCEIVKTECSEKE